MKKILIFLLLGMFLVSMVSAEQQSLGNFEINKDIEIIQICSNDTSLCSGCNISSITYPNSSRILSDVEMTKRLSDFNYTLDNSYNNLYGEYIVNGFCWTASEVEVWSYTFDVSKTGNKEISMGESIPLFIVSATLIFITLLFFMGYLKHESVPSKVTFGSFTIIFLFITILFNGLLLEDIISRYSNLLYGYATFLLVIKIMLSFGVLVFTLYAGLVALKLWRTKRGKYD